MTTTGVFDASMYASTSMTISFDSGRYVYFDNQSCNTHSDWIKCRFCNRRNRISESDGACKFCLGDLEIE